MRMRYRRCPRAPDVPTKCGQRLLHPQRGAHRTLGVVLVGDGRAEQREDAVTEELVDPAAERRDVVDQALEARVDEPLHLLRGRGARPAW